MSITDIEAAEPDEITTTDGITIELMWNIRYEYPSEYDADTRHLARGICARVKGDPGARDPFASAEYARHVRGSWEFRPTWVEGITDLGKALEDLIDNARARRAAITGRTKRITRTRTVLAEARQACADAATSGEPGARRHAAVQDAKAARHTVVIQAIREDLLPRHEIAELAGLDEFEMVQLARYVEPTTPAYYLSIADFALRLGISESALKSYRSRGMLPAEDILLGGSPGWLLSTADAYASTRRGQGFRSDLQQ